jgi:hypothetical protein
MNMKKLSIAALLAGSVVASADDPQPIVTPGGTKVQIYGRLELGAAYEDAATNTLWSWNAPRTAKDANDKEITPQGRTNLNIARTRLGLNLEGPSKEGEPGLKGRFEADFAGVDAVSNFNANTGFRVRQAWGSVNFKNLGLTLLFGQTDDVVTPIDPPAVNASSFNGTGNLGNRRPQIRATQAIGPIEIAVAATHDRLNSYNPQNGGQNVTNTDASGNVTNVSLGDGNASSTPGVQGRLGVKFPATWAGEKANFAVGVGGLFAKGEAANANDDKRYDRPEPSYMFGADLSAPIINDLTLTGEFFMGQNLNRYGTGSLGQTVAYGKSTSYVKNLGKSGNDVKDLGGIGSIGWWTGISAKLPVNFSVATGVGAESLDDDSKRVNQIESNMFIFGNVGYNFTSAAKLTFEYVRLSTDYTVNKGSSSVPDITTEDGSSNRFELNFRYDFK